MKKLLAVVLLLALPSLASAQAFRVGSGVQLVPRLTAPTKITTNGVVWLSSSTNALQFTNPAGTTTAIGAGGGGGGTIGGSIASGQVPVGSGANTVAGSANFAYVPTTGNLTVIGTASNSGVIFGGTSGFTLGDSTTLNTYLQATSTFVKLVNGASNTSVSATTTAVAVVGKLTTSDNMVFQTTAVVATAGAIRYNGTNLQYSDATTWVNFAAGGGTTFPLVDSSALNLTTTLVPHLTMDNTTITNSGATQQDSPALLLSGHSWTGSADTVDGWSLKAAQRSIGGSYSSLSISRKLGATFAEIMRIGGLPGESVITGAQGFNSGAISLNNNNIWFYSTFVDITATLPQVILNGTAFYPYAAYSTDLGASATPFGTVWSRQHKGVEQTIAAAATITIDPASGESIRVTLGATAITAINGAVGGPGQSIRVHFIQDATGTRTYGGFSAAANGFKLAAVVPTTTGYAAAKRDVYTFAWDAVAALWIETGRTTNF